MIIDNDIKELTIESIIEYIGILVQMNRKENKVEYKKNIIDAKEKIKNIISEEHERNIYKILKEYNKKIKDILQ